MDRRIRLGRRFSLLIVAAFGIGAAALLVGCTPEATAEMKATVGINAIRAQNGLPPLVPDPQLTELARLRSRDMASKNYFSHSPPDGCNYVCLMDARGVGHSYAGENIAWNTWEWNQTAEIAVRMWKDSPPHLSNILNCHYTRVGTGVIRAGNGRIYYTMVFEGNGGC
ncbi:MAG: CAP domain-containing protein [Dehalococcoidia bacterium]